MPETINGMLPKFALHAPKSLMSCFSRLKKLGNEAQHIDGDKYDTYKDLQISLSGSQLFQEYLRVPSPQKLQKVLQHLNLRGVVYSRDYIVFQRGFVNNSHSVVSTNRYLVMPFIVHSFAYECNHLSEFDTKALIRHATSSKPSDKTDLETLFLGTDEEKHTKAKHASKVLKASEFVLEAFQCSLMFGITDEVFSSLEKQFHSGKNDRRVDIMNNLHELLSFFSEVVADSVLQQAVSTNMCAVSSDRTDRKHLMAAIRVNMMEQLLHLITTFTLKPSLLAREQYEHQYSNHFFELLKISNDKASPENKKRSSVREYIINMLKEGGFVRVHEISAYLSTLVECVSGRSSQLPMFYLGYIGLVLQAIVSQPQCSTLNGGLLCKNYTSNKRIKFWDSFPAGKEDEERGVFDEVQIKGIYAAKIRQFALRERNGVTTNPLLIGGQFFRKKDDMEGFPTESSNLLFSLDHDSDSGIFAGGGSLCTPKDRLRCLNRHLKILSKHPEEHGISADDVPEIIHLLTKLTKVRLFATDNEHDPSVYTQLNLKEKSQEWSRYDPFADAHFAKEEKPNSGTGKKNKRKLASKVVVARKKKAKASTRRMTEDLDIEDDDGGDFNTYLQNIFGQHEDAIPAVSPSPTDDEHGGDTTEAVEYLQISSGTRESSSESWAQVPSEPVTHKNDPFAVGSHQSNGNSSNISSAVSSGSSATNQHYSASEGEKRRSTNPHSSLESQSDAYTPTPISSPSPEWNDSEQAWLDSALSDNLPSLADLPDLDQHFDISTVFDNEEKQSDDASIVDERIVVSKVIPGGGKVFDMTLEGAVVDDDVLWPSNDSLQLLSTVPVSAH